MTRVVVVGAGIVGLCTAASLRRRGADVVVLDQGPVGGGAARGNAGWICPAQLGPLASPHALREAVRNVGRPLAPVYVRPAGAVGLAPWLVRFVLASTRRRAAAATTALRGLDALSAPALDDLAAEGAALDGPRGIVVLHSSAEAARAAADAYGASGVTTGDALAALAPLVAEPHRLHGALLAGDRAIDPGAFVDSLAASLRARGVRLVEGAGLGTIVSDGEGVRALVDGRGERHEADAVVLAAGAGTTDVARRFGVTLALTGGKGYSFSVPIDRPAPHALLFEDEHVACTPLGGGLRIAGTMELGGRPGELDGRRVRGIERSARRVLAGADLDARRDVWVGPRPVTADGLPVIGRPRAWRNVLVGTGHGMYGVTLGPATGEVLAELAIGAPAPVDLAPFAPDRFRRRRW